MALRTVIRAWTLTVAVLLAGCGGDDDLVHVSGTATFKGQPIASGAIVFEPDSDAGNIGPQGFAHIKDGQFDTRTGAGKKVKAGLTILRIVGGDGMGADSMKPFGNKLFEMTALKADVKKDAPVLTVDVPAPKPAGK